jgi:CHAT domain-containing protein/tetratricopeptide (TPR) repeat protein
MSPATVCLALHVPLFSVPLPRIGLRSAFIDFLAITTFVALSAFSFPARTHAQQDQGGAAYQHAQQLLVAGKHQEALKQALRAVELTIKTQGTGNIAYPARLNLVASILETQGRYVESERVYRDSLDAQANLRTSDRKLQRQLFAETLNNLAGSLMRQSRFREAEATQRQSVVVNEETMGREAYSVGVSLLTLAQIHWSVGRFREGEAAARRSLSILSKTHKQAPGNEGVRMLAACQNILALIHEYQGRAFEAEAGHRAALEWAEKHLSQDAYSLSSMLINLGNFYLNQERYQDAAPFYLRSLSILDRGFGADHPQHGNVYNNLAVLFTGLGNYTEAETYFRKALGAHEKVGGRRDVASTLSHFAHMYFKQGRYAEAEQLAQRGLAIDEKVFGPDNLEVGHALKQLARIYESQGRTAETENLFRRSLDIYEKVLGAEHPRVAEVLSDLGYVEGNLGKWPSALQSLRRAAVIRAARGVAAAKEDRRGEDERTVFFNIAWATWRYAQVEPARRDDLMAESFEGMQLAARHVAGAALAQMALRFGATDPNVGPLVRERQDLVQRRDAVDAKLIAALGEPPNQRSDLGIKDLKATLADADKRMADLSARISAGFPEYADLVTPKPLSIAEVRGLLSPREALVVFHNSQREIFLITVTRDRAEWHQIPIERQALRDSVTALRCGLDHALWKGGEAQDRCVEMLNNKYSYQLSVDGMTVDVLPFDLERAHALYKVLLGPVEDLIKDKHLLVVPSGPLTSLPFNVLVTEPPKARMVASLAEHRQVAWLATRQPITVLPSVASLKALRQFAKASRANKLYLGVGNPLLDGPQDHPQYGEYFKQQAAAARANQRCTGQPTPIQIASARGRRAVASFTRVSRRGQADIEEVRRCTPLPDTADELCEVARRLGVPESEVLLGAQATETRLKQLSEQGQLANYAIVHFATHGALTGQVEGAAEPGLILTPPDKGTQDAKALERDDGFLTSSEIATLKLDADWVILSACNTAGAQGENAEALSGMARAFFYAGARALIVSHWEVGSGAAVKLATRAFAELSANPRLGRSEAFRLSMRELIDKGSTYDAHPSQWAPFVLVGEGAAAR